MRFWASLTTLPTPTSLSVSASSHSLTTLKDNSLIRSDKLTSNWLKLARLTKFLVMVKIVKLS